MTAGRDILNIYITNNDHTREQYQEFANYIVKHELKMDNEFIEKNIFIAKLIIDRGYDGIKYSSSIQKYGYNLCIFSCNDMGCIKYESRRLNEKE